MTDVPARTRCRVLHVLQPAEGGVPEHVACLAAGLPGHGWAVDVVAPSGSPFLGRFRAAGATVHEVDWPSAPGPADAAVAARLRRLDRRAGYDVVHAHSSRAGVLTRVALPDRRRLVYSPHCFSFAAGFSTSTRYVFRGIEQVLIPRTAALIAASEWEAALARRQLRGADRRLRVVRYGVDAIGGGDVDGELLRFKDGLPLAATICRLEPQKDPLTLVRAAAALRVAASSPWRLAIVGNGSLAAEVDAEIERLGLAGIVRRLPFRDGPQRYLRAVDVFVLPSRWESLPIAILEAMAAGLPIVGTRVSGVPEAVDDGHDGRLVEPGEPAQLADALRELLANPGLRAEYGAAARRKARERFGLDRMIREIAAIYDDLLV
jgi:glycosyltransferase involved in cell wall biosynthesis